MGSTSLIFFLVVVASVAVETFAVPIYNVVDSGAAGDGITNDTEVFLIIWKKACADPGSPTILIPSGKNFLVGPMKFNGPCRSPIHFQVDGQLTAPSKIWLDKIDEFGHWIAFNHVNGLIMDGEGQINGNGRPWWQLKEKQVCSDTPDVFLIIWKKACADPGSPTILIPSGKNFLVGPMKFNGPCRSPIHFQVDGQLTAPSKIWLDKIDEFGHWIAFNHVNGLIMDGEGQINGNGRPWWQLKEKQVCSDTPDGLFIIHSSNVTISNLNFIDSPKKHIIVDYTDNVYISNLTITAPGTSPNTDGIHIQSSQHIQIMDSVIGTGDDCISIGNGTFDLNITRIICGPGHGISIGSLGKNNTDAIVGLIHVSDCDIHNTTNGVRIKTWPGRSSGYAKGITFERINFTSVERPIIIDQNYCDKKCNTCPTKPTDLQVSEIRYSGITGSTVGPLAITLNCTSTVGCLGINMMDVDIQSVNGTAMETYCVNAKGTMSARVSPPLRCV